MPWFSSHSTAFAFKASQPLDAISTCTQYIYTPRKTKENFKFSVTNKNLIRYNFITTQIKCLEVQEKEPYDVDRDREAVEKRTKVQNLYLHIFRICFVVRALFRLLPIFSISLSVSLDLFPSHAQCQFIFFFLSLSFLYT